MNYINMEGQETGSLAQGAREGAGFIKKGVWTHLGLPTCSETHLSVCLLLHSVGHILIKNLFKARYETIVELCDHEYFVL